MEELSMMEKEQKCLNMAYDLGYQQNVKNNDLVWNLIDFGYQREHDIMDGKASLNTIINFNMKEWEDKMDKDIKELNQLYKK